MAGFDRSKLKTTSNAALEKQKQEQAQKRPQGGGGGFGDNLSIEDGINKFRLAPFHPDDSVPEEDQRYAEAKCVSFLEVTRPKKDDQGKVIEGQTEVKSFPIFNAKVHGNLSKDPIEAYMEFAKETAIPNFTEDQDKAKQIWSRICGYKDSKGKYHGGIKPQDTWAVYAWKLINGEWKLGLLEIKKTVKDQLTELALTITDGESPDPYTDPEDGYVIQINKTGSGIDTRYKVSIDEKMFNKVDSQKVVLRLSDEQLEEWSKLPSLRKRFVNSYTQKDFQAQLEGLQNFEAKLREAKLDINCFSYDQFLDTLERISVELSEKQPQSEQEEEQQEEKPKQQVAKSTAKTTTTAKQPVKKSTPPPEDASESPFYGDGEQPKASVSSRLNDIRSKYKK